MKIYKSRAKEKIKISTRLLVFYLLLTPLDFLPIIQGVSVSKMIIFIPLTGCLFHIKDMKIHLDRFLVFPILYVIMLFVTTFYSYDFSLTIERTISVALNIGIILILTMLGYSRREVEIIKKALVFSGWLTLALIIFYSDTSIMGGRITVVVNGIFQDPNYLTGFLIFAIIYYFDGFMKNKSIKSLVKMIIFLVFILLTGSRGGLLAILGSMIFYIFMRMKEKRLKISSIITVISFIFIMGVIFNFTLDMLPDPIAQRYDISFTLNDGGAGRVDIWKSIFYNYKNSPVFNKFFGSGAGTIRYFTYNGNVAHNIWIESLMEVGVIGVVILFNFYFIYFKKAFKIGDYVTTAAFVGYMIMGMSMSLYSYKPIWNILMFIMILKNNNRNIENNTRKDKQLIIRGMGNES